MTADRPQQRSFPCNQNHEHSLATAALCACSFSNAFLVISVFPYAGYMALDLVKTATSDTAGVYAGMIASSFFAARFVTAYPWGHFADRHGRKFTLQLALFLSAVFSILFGLSRSFALAILWRACLGMSNCILSTTKTIAAEISDNEKLQRRTMGLVVGMRGLGLLIAPAIGGFLAEPTQQYPDFLDQQKTSWYFTVLETFPFLLPNVFGAACCLLAATAVHFLVSETLHCYEQEETTASDCSSIAERMAASRRNEQLPAPKAIQEDSPLLSKNGDSGSSHDETSVWNRPITRSHMIVHWWFSIITTYIDEAFPLFCMSVTGGLALLESEIGKIMSIAGLLFAVLQYVTFASITAHFGLYRSLMIGCVLGTLPAAFIPVSLFFKHDHWLMMVYLSTVMGFTKLMHSLYFTSMAVAINRTVNATQRARMNALVVTGNSIGKAFGPSFAGALVTFSFSSLLFPALYGSLLVWTLVPLMGLVVALRIRRLQRQMTN